MILSSNGDSPKGHCIGSVSQGLVLLNYSWDIYSICIFCFGLTNSKDSVRPLCHHLQVPENKLINTKSNAIKVLH